MTCPSPADQKRQKEITDLGDASLFLEILVQVLVTMLPQRQYTRFCTEMAEACGAVAAAPIYHAWKQR